MTTWILLTATVHPYPGVAVALADPDARRSQYVAALARWSSWSAGGAVRLVVAENSLANSHEVRAALDPTGGAAHVEFLSVQAPDVGERGKGAAEAAMIDEAVSRLARVPDGPATRDLIFKVTGRLFVTNATRVLPPAGGTRRAVVRTTLDHTYADTRLIGANPGVWGREFAGMAAEVDEQSGIFLEHVVADRLHQAAVRRTLTVARFAGHPVFSGSSGTGGLAYGGCYDRVRVALGRPVETLLRRLPPGKQY